MGMSQCFGNDFFGLGAVDAGLAAADLPFGVAGLLDFRNVAGTAEETADVFGGGHVVHADVDGVGGVFQRVAGTDDGFGAGQTTAVERNGHGTSREQRYRVRTRVLRERAAMCGRRRNRERENALRQAAAHRMDEKAASGCARRAVRETWQHGGRKAGKGAKKALFTESATGKSAGTAKIGIVIETDAV